MRSFIYRVMPSWILNLYLKIRLEVFDGYARKSYSQEGEDMILRRIFEHQIGGFYVDVGAHHPKRFSNTYYFYKQNWHGINIDATPGSMEMFRKLRPKDINLEVGIALKKGSMTYYRFNDPALNTFDEQLALQRADSERYFIQAELVVSVVPLSDVLQENLPENQIIDFISVDVEGLDLQVLHSNDWQRFRPRFVLVECLEVDSWGRFSDPVYDFLKVHGYEPLAKTYRTMIYRDTVANA